MTRRAWLPGSAIPGQRTWYAPLTPSDLWYAATTHPLRVHIEPSLSTLTSLLVDAVCRSNPTYRRLPARPPDSLRQRTQTIQRPRSLHADPGGNRRPNVPGTSRIATLHSAGHRMARFRPVRILD